MMDFATVQRSPLSWRPRSMGRSCLPKHSGSSICVVRAAPGDADARADRISSTHGCHLQSEPARARRPIGTTHGCCCPDASGDLDTTASGVCRVASASSLRSHKAIRRRLGALTKGRRHGEDPV
jgi:hypothetical protein